MPRLDRGGYSLIELLTVLVIVGIATQLAVPSVSGMLRTWRSKQAASQVTADLAYARMLAIRSGAGASVVFLGSDEYRVEEGVAPATVTARKTVDLQDEFGPVVVQRPAGVDVIVFNPRGMATSGAGVFVVQSSSSGTMRQDTLWVSVLGMVRREG